MSASLLGLNMKLVSSQQLADETISKMQLEMAHAAGTMTKMLEDHAYDVRNLRQAISAATTRNAELTDELNAARTHAALVESDLEGTKSALQLHLLTPGQGSPRDLGLSAQQEDAIFQEWEAVVEDLKVTHGAHITEMRRPISMNNLLPYMPMSTAKRKHHPLGNNHNQMNQSSTNTHRQRHPAATSSQGLLLRAPLSGPSRSSSRGLRPQDLLHDLSRLVLQLKSLLRS